MTSTYHSEGDHVRMDTGNGAAWLNHDQCERLLAIYDEAGAAQSFNALYAAFLEAGGIPIRSAA